MTPGRKIASAIKDFEEARSGLISAMRGVDAVRGRRMSPPRPERGSVERRREERLEDWKAARAVLETAVAHMRVAESLLDFVLIREVDPILKECPERLDPIEMN